MSSSNCCFLTCIQISQEAGKVVWYSIFPQSVLIHTVKGFGIVNKAEIDVFLELFCFFDDPVDVGHLIYGSSAFSKTSLNIWKFTVHLLLKPGLENFEHYFIGMWDECNCAIVWAFFVTSPRYQVLKPYLPELLGIGSEMVSLYLLLILSRVFTLFTVQAGIFSKCISGQITHSTSPPPTCSTHNP